MPSGFFSPFRVGSGLTWTDDGDGGGTLSSGGGFGDGWTSAGTTWTYASGSGGGTATFTVSGDLTATFPKGARIKLTQTTVKYFNVIGATHAAGTTTVTITAGTDYTLANAAITDPFYSYILTPQGFPSSFTFAPAPTGFTGAVTISIAEFVMIGATMYLSLDMSGTSNATTFAFTLPAAAAYVSGLSTVCFITDNGTNSVNPGLVNNSAATTACQIYRTLTLLGWTASGIKRALFNGSYVV